MKTNVGILVPAIIIATVSTLGPALGSRAATAPSTSTPAAASEVLDLGMRIASSISSDAKDRARAQESVVLETAMQGAIDQAARLAEQIDGWRRGVAQAEIAAMAARAGRFDLARSLIAAARKLAESPQGWEPSRVLAHVARAEALLGRLDSAKPATERLVAEDEQQYRGFPGIAEATAHAARGEFDAAMRALDAVSEEPGFELGWWRASAYIDLARAPGLSEDRRKRALEAAVAATLKQDEMINRLDTLERVANAYQDLGIPEGARAVLGQSAAITDRLPDSTVLKGSFLAGQARVWARIGEVERSGAILERALTAAAKAPAIDRPAVLANIAAGYGALGDAASTARVLGQAIQETESLVNARPRALAAVEICRAVARFGVPLSAELHGRLERIHRGLKAPW